jgi:hypothetical protein
MPGWDLLTGHQPVPCERCGTPVDGPGPGAICPACDQAEQSTWLREDRELSWGYAEATCAHGVPLSGYCHTCETECVHGNYGPGCPDCAGGA